MYLFIYFLHNVHYAPFTSLYMSTEGGMRIPLDLEIGSLLISSLVFT
jgi:hypothetical protein